MLLSCPSHYIQQFIGDSLLAVLVVLQCQFLDQVVGIVVGGLHSQHTSGMFGSRIVEQCRVVCR